jgi:hypothetical protein
MNLARLLEFVLNGTRRRKRRFGPFFHIVPRVLKAIRIPLSDD